MALIPKWKKYKKYHKQKLQLTALTRQVTPLSNFGAYSICTLEPGRIAARHFESMQRTSRRLLKKAGKVWITGFPHLPISSKPLEIRMGKGKGAVAYWAMPVRAGSTLFEISGVPDQQAIRTLQVVRKKLPVRTRIYKNTLRV